jgi:hypothetical protein
MCIYIDPSLNTSNNKWHISILNILANTVKGLSLKFTSETATHIINPCSPHIIDVNDIIYLRDLIFNFYNIEHPIVMNKFKVLYTRERDTNRRHLLNSHILKDKFDLIINSLDIPFEEQLKIFKNASHFVSPDGAHCTNIMFMNPSAKFLKIYPRNYPKDEHTKGAYNCWQTIFGLSNTFIKGIDFIEADKITTSGHVILFNENIYVDDKLRDDITNWLEN